MSRVIKFRAWDSHLSEMIRDVHLLDSFNEKLARDRYVMLQFTGLLDKNGVEIYEGDIVAFDGSTTGPRLIEWADIGWTMTPEYEPRSLYELWERNRLEVIGNIHQSPELLESK